MLYTLHSFDYCLLLWFRLYIYFVSLILHIVLLYILYILYTIHLHFTVFLRLRYDRCVSLLRPIFAVLLMGVCVVKWLFCSAFISSKVIAFVNFINSFMCSLSSSFYWLGSHLSLVLTVLMHFCPCLKVCIQILGGLYFGCRFRRGRSGFLLF